MWDLGFSFLFFPYFVNRRTIYCTIVRSLPHVYIAYALSPSNRRGFIYSLRSFSYCLGVKLHGNKELTEQIVFPSIFPHGLAF